WRRYARRLNMRNHHIVAAAADVSDPVIIPGWRTSGRKHRSFRQTIEIAADRSRASIVNDCEAIADGRSVSARRIERRAIDRHAARSTHLIVVTSNSRSIQLY